MTRAWRDILTMKRSMQIKRCNERTRTALPPFGGSAIKWECQSVSRKSSPKCDDLEWDGTSVVIQSTFILHPKIHPKVHPRKLPKMDLFSTVRTFQIQLTFFWTESTPKTKKIDFAIAISTITILEAFMIRIVIVRNSAVLSGVFLGCNSGWKMKVDWITTLDFITSQHKRVSGRHKQQWLGGSFTSFQTSWRCHLGEYKPISCCLCNMGHIL